MHNRLDINPESTNTLSAKSEARQIGLAMAYAQSQEKHPVFKSRFKPWIRAVALAVVICFIPEQISSAINYDPVVLWGRDKSIKAITSESSPEEIQSTRIAASIQNLLQQIESKEHQRIQIQLPAPQVHPMANGPADASLENNTNNNLQIDSKILVTPKTIGEVTRWLSKPEIHPINCGVHALKTLLDFYEIKPALEELSVVTLVVDLLSDI